MVYPQDSARSVLLPDNRVLVAGGLTPLTSSQAETYDPITGTWSAAGSMTARRTEFSLVALKNGKVLAIGGNEAAGSIVHSSAELYDPTTNLWTQTGSLTQGPRDYLSANLLPDGRVIVIGGTPNSTNTPYSVTEIYDPATGTFTVGPSLNFARQEHASVVLPNGSVVVMGGYGSAGLSSVELLNLSNPASTNTSLNTINTPATSSNKTAGSASGTNWTGTTNTASSDNSYAAYNNTAQDYLKLTNFGFTTSDVPSNATITGISASIEGNASSGAGSQSSAGPNSPSTCVNTTGTGTVAWGTPSSCTTSNNSYATASVDGTTTNWLSATGFGFSIPSTATVNGIQVEVERKASATNNGAVDDAAARLIKGGTIQSTDATLLQDWSITEQYVSYGGSSSLWGTTWTAADVNSSNFGFALSATKASAAGAAITASVDHVRITVTYTTASGNLYNVCLTKDGSSCTGTEKTNQTLNVSTDSTVVKGGSSDLWGSTWSISQVTASTFGIFIKDADADASAINFDQVQLSISYTTPSSPQVHTSYANTSSMKSDLVKDSDGNIQLTWQTYRVDGASAGRSNAGWKIALQKLDNPSSGTVTKQYPSSGADTLSPTGVMSKGRTNFSGTMLPNGKTLIAGGASTGGDLSTAEIYDPYSNTWSTTPTMKGPLSSHKMFTLTSGKAFAVSMNPGQNSQIYDPSANTWTLANNPNVVRLGADAVMLNDGKILLAGGCTSSCTVLHSTAELYNPATGTWTYTNNSLTQTVKDNTLVKLPDGTVRSMGGCTSSTDCNSAYTFTSAIYRYDPIANLWSPEGDMTVSSKSVKAVALNTGNILILTAQIYDGVVSVIDDLNQYIYYPSSATNKSLGQPGGISDALTNGGIVLPSGKVLGANTTETHLFNPQLETWETGPVLSATRSNPFSTIIKTGQVLYAGGGTSISSVDLYTAEPSEKIVTISDDAGIGNQTNPKLSADTANGTTYIAWNDQRLSSPSDTSIDSNIYIQRVSSSGNPTWPNGSNSNGSYNVRDVRINNTRGSLDTTVQTNVSMAKSIFDNNNSDGTYPLQIAWDDSRDTTPVISSYGQSYDTRDRTMSSTTWTAYYYVTGNPSASNSITIQVGATESDGETMSYTSASSTYTGDGTNGEKSTVFSNLPPTGETSLTHRRIALKLTYSAGSMQIQYNGAAGVADTRLNTGMVVPERSLLIATLIPLIPGLAYGSLSRRRLFTRSICSTSGTGKK